MRKGCANMIYVKAPETSIIEDTKTSSGIRDIPITSKVAECFHRIINEGKKVKAEPMSNNELYGIQIYIFLPLIYL